MSKLMNNRSYLSIIVTLLFIMVGGLLFAGTPVYAAPLAQTPDIVVTLTANPTTISENELGADIAYTLRIQNQHSATIRIIDLNDSFGTILSQGSCPAADALIGFGQTLQCTYTRNLVLNPGTLNNLANVEVSTGGAVPTNTETDDVDVTVQDTLPSFTVTKTADRSLVGVDAPNPYDEVTFTIEVQNSSVGESVQITALDDSVYGDVTALPAPGSSTCVLPQPLAPSGQVGDSYTCTYTIPAQTGSPAFLNPPYMNPAYAPGELRTVTSSLTATGNDNDVPTSRNFSSGNVSVRFTDQAADLAVTAVDERGARGENVTFTVVLTNNGPDNASNASVAITNIDPDLTYIGATATSGSYAPGSGIWSGISITSGNTAELNLTFRIDVPMAPVDPWGPQPAVNLSPAFDAEARPGNQYDATPGNDTDDPDLDVVVGVEISKTNILIDNDVSGDPTVGDGLSWIICVENMDAVSQAPDSTVLTAGILVNDTMGAGQSITLRRWAPASTCPATIGDLAALTWTTVGAFPVNVGKLAANGNPGDVGVVNIETVLNAEGFTLSSLMPVEIVQPDNSATNSNDNFVKPDAGPPVSTAATIQVEPEPFPLALVISAAIVILAFVLLTIFNLRNLSFKIRLQPVSWAQAAVMLVVMILAVFNFTQPLGAFAQEETPETPTDTVTPTDEPAETETEAATEDTTTPEPSDTPEDDETESPEPSETEDVSETPEETETPVPSETEETETPEPSETEETETPEPSETEETETEEPTAVPTLSDQLNTPTPTVDATETSTATPTGKETIGGVIWVDVDENGAVSGEDAPAINMVVALYMDDGDQAFDAASDTFIDETSTDAEGAYRFARLEKGKYWVVVDTTTLPEEAVPGQQLAPQAVSAPGVVNFLLVARTDINTDFSQGPGRITGMAFNDNNGNRLWDGDVESGLRYVDVVLYLDTGDNAFDPASDQEIARVTTDWDGVYTFDQLGEGRYWVLLDESTLPEHYMDTVGYGGYGIQNPQEVVLSDLPQGVFANARIDVEGPYFAYTLDTDGDGSPDGVEGGGDRDSDGIPNYLDSYDPSGTVFGWDGTNGNAVSGVSVGLYRDDDGNGQYDGTEPLANVSPQANPQITGADGAYRFDILVGTPNGIPTTGTATFLLVIDEDSLPEQYSFGLTPLIPVPPPPPVIPPWNPLPTLDVNPGPGTQAISGNPYPPNAAGVPYHIAFTIEEDDMEVVNNHIPLTVHQLEGGWVNEACAYRSTASTAQQVCDQEPELTGTILDATFEPNQSSTTGVTVTRTYCHVLTNESTNDERFTIRFPAGSQGWSQSLVISTGNCASIPGSTTVQTISQGGSYTTNPIPDSTSPNNELFLEHYIIPPLGTADGEIDVTTITAESVTDPRLTRTVTDITTATAGTIEGLVFDDNNQSGLQDTGEADLAGVRVELLSSTFASIAETTTDANGEYTFDGVAPATYYVRLDSTTLSNPVYVNPTSNRSPALLVLAGTTTVQNFAVNVDQLTPIPPALLTLSVSPTSVAAGGTATYTITIQKDSTPPDMTNVVVTIVMNSLLTVGTPSTTQGTATVAQGTHGVYLKGVAAQTSRTVTWNVGTVVTPATGTTTVTMTIPVTVSSSATAQTIYHTANGTGNSGPTPITSSAGPVGLTITTTSAQATATADAANANATSTASAAESSSSSSGSSSASTSADTLPLTGYVSHPAAGNNPAQVLANILTGVITALLVIAGLAIGTWGLLLYFERLPESFLARFDWLQSDRTWYAGSIVFTIVMTLFIVLQVIAPPMDVTQVAEVPAEAETQAPVDMVAVSAANDRGVQPSAAPNATRHIKPPDPATRLLIPKLEIDTGVVDAQAIGNTWDVTTFKDEAAHLEGTAHLGTLGNAVIAGHVRTEEGLGVFRNVKQLDVGDQIIAQGDNVEYVYEVLWVEEVDPSEMAVVAPSDEAILTLITCTDWDSGAWTYLSRLIVRAKLVEVRPIE